MANDTNSLLWLQLVRTPDNHLTGQLASFTLSSDGRIAKESVAVTGAVNAEDFTISVSRFWGLQTTTLAGALAGDKLTLLGLTPSPIVLKRTDLKAYQQKLGSLNEESAHIISAKKVADARNANLASEVAALYAIESTQSGAQALRPQEEKTTVEIHKLLPKLQRFDTEADVHLARFQRAENRYREITAKISQYVDRERILANSSDEGNTRSELSESASEAVEVTDKIHESGQAFRSSLEKNVKPMVSYGNRLESDCSANSNQGSPTPQEAESRRVACHRLSPIVQQSRQKYDAIINGLAHLEVIYLQERKKQQVLLEEAHKLR